MMDIKTKLIKHLDTFQAAPFLFVGSGLSRRYLNLEGWAELIKKFCVCDKPYSYYKGKAGGDYPEKIAETLSKDFYEKWWNSNEYENSKKEFSSQTESESSPLKFEISKYLREKKYQSLNIDIDKEIEQLKKVCIDGVITTNWDLLLEEIFSDFKIFVGQEELLFSNLQGIAEIYKIHGCSSQPNSLILTSDDYANFDEKNPYLASKLLTIFIEHPVIFIGYSIRDINISKILNSISSCLNHEKLEKLKNNLIFIQRLEPNEDEYLGNSVFSIGGDKNLPITLIKTDNFLAIYEALSFNKRKYSAKTLRHLKSEIYELVKSNDPKEKLYVLDLENNNVDLSKLEIVFGVGIISKFSDKGYTMIEPIEIFEDIIMDSKDYNSEEIISITLPKLLKSNKHLPIFKYLKAGNFIAKNEINKLDINIQKKIKYNYDDFLNLSQKNSIENNTLNINSINKLIEIHGENKCIILLPILGKDKICINTLQELLIRNVALLKTNDVTAKSSFRKAVLIYDWLKHGPHTYELQNVV